MSSTPQVVSRPPFWVKLSVVQGNVLQVAGLVVGAGLLYMAAHNSLGALIAIVLMLLGWLVIYCCCHAIAHWLVGWLVGIRFRGYGLRGTDHPENQPPLLRPLFRAMPFFTVMTQKESMAKASPTAQALMFAAGETSTTLSGIAAAWYAWHENIPGGNILLIFAVLWGLSATVATAMFPKGDYAKALKALRRA